LQAQGSLSGKDTMQKHRMGVIAAVSVILVAMASTGCKGKRQQEIDTSFTPDPGATGGDTFESTAGEGLPSIDMENAIFESADGVRPVYFDYDSYSLRPDALETLRANAEKLKQIPGVIVQIEGHCDSRGTQEYNLALGERRALAVREHLIRLGISGDRMVTISYGEEDPVDPGHTEAAYALNRRCEFNRAR
jgi:peptidoglycan-associated lipoprotein